MKKLQLVSRASTHKIDELHTKGGLTQWSETKRTSNR